MNLQHRSVARTCAILSLWLVPIPLLRAEVALPSLFADHMVLQRNQPLPLWGTATAGEQITVSIQDQRLHCTADAAGQWRVTLAPMTGDAPLTLTVKGSNEVVIRDVLLGEVWVCSGQSNMNMQVSRCLDAEQVIAAADNPQIRHFQTSRKVSPTPLADAQGNWSIAGPDTVGAYTATGYFFARDLHERLGVPIGLIHTSWGGTPAEAWTPRQTLESLPECRPILERFSQALAVYPEQLEAYNAKVTAFRQRLQAWNAKVKAEGQKAAGPRPRAPRAPLSETHPHSPAGLYNAMLHPFIPFAIRGAIWYQGESNASRAYQYRTLFPAMITSWRQAWNQGDFPFYFVQLANYRAAQTDPNAGSTWAELREAQSMALALKHSGMACIIDAGEANDIHPRDKQIVGKRLALLALAQDYGQQVNCCGPTYTSMSQEADAIRVTFSHAENGLLVKGERLTGFTIAGPEQTFVWADANVEGNTVLLRAEGLTNPVAVRYGWADNPPCNLYNQEGLPAVPFRTDQWPGITAEQF